mmetsp:Transcript_13285/g.20177  ORF Transcript_13285/g.20177 Transcript_13285/m.20177 type:complete len:299 (+) Transcript_13285:158-1054(+)
MQLLSTSTALTIPLLFHQIQTTTATVDMTIDAIASDVLYRALERIPDGAAVTTAVAEKSIDKYVDISALPVFQDFDLNDTRLSGILAFNASIFDSVDGNLRTKVSWTVSSCICVDINCDNTSSIDIRGGLNLDAAGARGYSPILFHDIRSDDMHHNLPCLAVYHSPLTNKDEVAIGNNCSFVDGYLPHSLISHRFEVKNCLNGPVDNMRLYEKSRIDGGYFSDPGNYGMAGYKYFGRPLTGTEITPSNTLVDTYDTIGDLIDDIPFTKITIPVVNIDITDILKGATTQIAKKVSCSIC